MKERIKLAGAYEASIMLRTLNEAIDMLKDHPEAQEILKQRQRLFIHRWVNSGE